MTGVLQSITTIIHQILTHVMDWVLMCCKDIAKPSHRASYNSDQMNLDGNSEHSNQRNQGQVRAQEFVFGTDCLCLYLSTSLSPSLVARVVLAFGTAPMCHSPLPHLVVILLNLSIKVCLLTFIHILWRGYVKHYKTSVTNRETSFLAIMVWF